MRKQVATCVLAVVGCLLLLVVWVVNVPQPDVEMLGVRGGHGEAGIQDGRALVREAGADDDEIIRILQPAIHATKLVGWVLCRDGSQARVDRVLFSNEHGIEVLAPVGGDSYFEAELSLGEWRVTYPGGVYAAVSERIVIKEGDDQPIVLRAVLNGVSIDGVVYSEKTGIAIAGARVVSGSGEQATETHSGLTGEFHLFASVRADSCIELRATHPKFGPTRMIIQAESSGYGEGVSIPMPETLFVEGRVVDSEGAAIEGVAIRDVRDKVAAVKTASDGTYRLQVASAHRIVLSASCEGYVGQVAGVMVVAGESLGYREWVLQLMGFVDVVVAKEDGSLCVGADVRRGWRPGAWEKNACVTDAGGKVRLRSLGSREMYVIAAKGEAECGVALILPGWRHATIVLRPATTRSLKVLDGNGRPIEGATVKVLGPYGYGTRTNGMGVSIVRTISANTKVRVLAQGYQAKVVTVGDSYGSQCQLAPSATIAGVVVSVNGSAVQGFTVMVLGVRRDSEVIGVPAEWAHSGLQFAGLAGQWSMGDPEWQVGDRVRVRVSARGYASCENSMTIGAQSCVTIMDPL